MESPQRLQVTHPGEAAVQGLKVVESPQRLQVTHPGEAAVEGLKAGELLQLGGEFGELEAGEIKLAGWSDELGFNSLPGQHQIRRKHRQNQAI